MQCIHNNSSSIITCGKSVFFHINKFSFLSALWHFYCSKYKKKAVVF